LQPFYNLELGLPFEEKGWTIESGSLLSRLENFGTDTLDDKVRWLTASIDVQGGQDARLEVVICGWSIHEECWVTEASVLRGDVESEELWADLWAYLCHPFHTASGRTLGINVVCVDVGFVPDMGYRFCKLHHRSRVFACKGLDGPLPIFPRLPKRTKTSNLQYQIGVSTAKSSIYGRLRIQEPGPRYIHFSNSTDLDQAWFDQLTSEKRIVKRTDSGRAVHSWFLSPGKRNEALDCMVLCLAGFCSRAGL
jgi:phage terminase large subunit GpA-like protein